MTKYYTVAAQILPAPLVGWRGKSGAILILIAIVNKKRKEEKKGETEIQGQKTQGR